MTKGTEAKKTQEAEATHGVRTPIKWDTSKLVSSYANFCNANSTREEVVLNFGVNKTWERGRRRPSTSSSTTASCSHRSPPSASPSCCSSS